ncbi:MAG TPA: glycoside hydrolase family 15 protein [Candidatus Paceibacterota bacterium]|nr:glycoside hydrolase family 15 protein [Candidatus Paceibacterota bacterium]
MTHPIHQKLIAQHLKILEGLQYDSGLFAASEKGIGTGYDKAWLRDNFYECLAFEVIGDYETVQKTYRAILTIFKRHEYKIDYAINRKPQNTYEYIHPRYHPITFDEYWEEWGNKQNDSIGCILFKIGELEKRQAGLIIESADDARVLQKLVWYLSTLEYWGDPDSGVWEENQEIHASSVGACLAGLKMIRGVSDIEVSPELIFRGEENLHKILPRESNSKFVDLALLSLIWPYSIVTKAESDEILTNVEYHLLRERGVIRYKGDRYYNKNPDGYSEEAEWTFGLSWLAIIYERRGDLAKAKEYLEKAKQTVTKRGVPELYFSNSMKYNDNTPLGWSESLFIVALYEVNEHFHKHKHKA